MVLWRTVTEQGDRHSASELCYLCILNSQKLFSATYINTSRSREQNWGLSPLRYSLITGLWNNAVFVQSPSGTMDLAFLLHSNTASTSIVENTSHPAKPGDLGTLLGGGRCKFEPPQLEKSLEPTFWVTASTLWQLHKRYHYQSLTSPPPPLLSLLLNKHFCG